WMAATTLATYTSRDCRVTLVESDAIGIVGVGEATIPPIKKFNNFIRIDEDAFIRETAGTFKLGIEFHNWGRIGDRYLHQFGRTGRELDEAVQLHHWWIAGRLAGAADYPAYEDLFPARALAKADKFVPPGRQKARHPLNRHAYAYHFDAHYYAAHLRKIAEQRGAKRVEGRITGVERDSETGHVAAVLLEDGRKLEADLFIDCSGFRSLLLGTELGEPFDDWSQWLPADRAIAVPTERGHGPITPYTKGIAHSVGWQWRIPLQHRTGNGHVYSSSFSSESEAEQRLLRTIDARPLADPRVLKFETGRRQRAWVGNVVAIGLSAGFLEPLESTSIHLVQAALERLVELFPSRRMDPDLRDIFNARTRTEWERVRDFVIAHYKVTERDDSEFWNYTRTMEIPDSLKATLETWREHGLLDVDGGHLFQLGSWSAVLIGQRLFPKRVHALADRADPDYLVERMRELASELDGLAKSQPDHAEYIARHHAMRVPEATA
ncbi:MAG TPA: tryptophan halogenase family protein, partial [Sphingomonadaceae bacterium]|nr:tryptophan halogenase family protein [Sphingomonadaceae bacterium]